jgi:formiminotetrahydrofolate cyclodeaminase
MTRNPLTGKSHHMDFVDRIASYAPVPAGGAAVANCFCLAVALVYKVAIFEAGRNLPTSPIGSNLAMLKKQLEKLLRDAEKLVEEDSEAYLNFSRSRRMGDSAQMNRHFNDIVDVSMKIMEKSDVAYEWIRQLHRVAPQQMNTHLLVASELLMGAINGTVHIVRENLASIEAFEKRDNYLERINKLHGFYIQRYHEIMDVISKAPQEPDSDVHRIQTSRKQ